MSEEKIAERIDANILDVAINDLKSLPLSVYEKKLKNSCADVKGKLIIKEYPTSTANANHFRFLLDELSLKRNSNQMLSLLIILISVHLLVLKVVK